jgi:lipid-binding SYLF domain-containing protein
MSKSTRSAKGTTAALLLVASSRLRRRGLFAGAELGGAVVKQDVPALAAFYGDGADLHAILGGAVSTPREAAAFLEHVAVAFPNVPIALAP